jgi:arylsulfatase A-like enzyme
MSDRETARGGPDRTGLGLADGPVAEPRRPRAGGPNIVMIVLDDLGFAQLGSYGSDISTPAIDELATQGLRYSNFHVTALCSPTRACLLTGRNHHAVGMGFLTHNPILLPGYTGRIPTSAGTLPRLLRDAGYNTFAAGKWHLIPRYEDGPTGPFDQWPLAKGFERFYGFLDAGTSQWTPDLVRDNGFIEQPLAPEDGYHLTEDLASQAIRFVQDQQHAAPDKPFFLYFAPGAVHSPHHVPSSWIEPYRNQFDIGWDTWRRRTFERQQECGVVPSDTVLTERPPWVAEWDGLPEDERLLYSRMMETFAGFLTHTDAQIERLMSFLERINVLDDTIVLLLSDNGASADGGPNGFFNRPELDDVEYMASRADDLGGFRAYNIYDWGWAWAGNTPFRLWKHYTWLGGVRTPLIVRWPSGIAAADNGSVRTQFCHAVDLMPTVLDAAGIDVPDVLDGVRQQPIDGKSLLGTFGDGDAPSPRNTQYFEMMGSRAIYHDGWKATTDHVDSPYRAERERVHGSPEFESDKWSLFCLESDFSEAHDLAEAHPDRLRRMIEVWWSEAERNQVLPLMNHEDRLAAMEPPPGPPRHRYVYLPGGSPVVTPSPFLAGFRVVVDIDVPDDHNAGGGIICAQGDWNGGWACYFLDRQLIVTFNFGDGPRRVVAREAIPPGRRELGIEYFVDGGGGGSARITDNGAQVGAGSVSSELTVLARMGLGVGKLRIGYDQGFPVCDDYRPPFEFTGRIHRVVFEVPQAPPSADSAMDVINALRND